MTSEQHKFGNPNGEEKNAHQTLTPMNGIKPEIEFKWLEIK